MSDVPTTTTTTMTTPIYMVTVSAGTNIACIKYWGKADSKYNTPINDSISITLDQKDLCAITTVAASTTFTRDTLWLNGIEETNAPSNPRFRACVDQVKALATDKVFTNDDGTTTTVTKQQWQQMYVHVSSYNTFPTAAGLASSAAGYAALVSALTHLMNAVEVYPYQFSTIARQGSGSACRSLYGGCVAWRKGSSELEWKDSIAEPICPTTNEQHWPEIRAVIMVVSDSKKDTSSTSGMSTSVNTSTLIQYRAQHVVPQRMVSIIEAWKTKDFTTFGKLTMQDSNQFHSICSDTYPPIFYMNDISKIIIRIVTCYNQYYTDLEKKEVIRAAYTFDAGPNAVLYCLDEYAIEIGAIMYHYFPSDSLSSYINDPDYAAQITSYTFDPEFVAYMTNKCQWETMQYNNCTTAQQPDVRKIYYTKAGTGPQLRPDICNLDPITGRNTYVPPS